MKLQNKNIIIISPESWGKNHLSKHHYAIELSNRNNQVWFVNPPATNDSVTSDNINSNLQIISYKPFIRGKNRMPSILSRKLHKFEINKILKITKAPDILWSFDPYRFQWMQDFKAKIKIFHPVDEHSNTLYLNLIGKNSDYIFSVAQKILDNIRVTDAKKHLIPHGVSINAKKPAKLIKLPGNNKIKTCYVGNFYNILDLDFILELVKDNYDVDFIFIGPYKNSNLGKAEYDEIVFNRLKSLKNCWLLGEVDPLKLNAYLKASDINFVIYKDIQLNSHKLMLYLYSGKAVVSTPIEEYKNNNLIETTNKGEEFLALFSNIKNNLSIYNSLEKQNERINYAKNYSYSALIDKIESILNI